MREKKLNSPFYRNYSIIELKLNVMCNTLCIFNTAGTCVEVVGSHLKARGLCLLCALVEVGHWLSVEINPGVEVRIRGLLRGRTRRLA